MGEAVVVSFARTAVADAYKGSLAGTPIVELGKVVVAEALKRSGPARRGRRRHPRRGPAGRRRPGPLHRHRPRPLGGAVGIGHPVAASGARILGHLVAELRRRGGRYGVASLCAGGGMGVATVVEALPA